MDIKQTETFRVWERRLRDRRARTIIAARLMRLAEDFQRRGNALIVLLCGGNKSSQERDITRAKELAKEWSVQDVGETDDL